MTDPLKGFAKIIHKAEVLIEYISRPIDLLILADYCNNEELVLSSNKITMIQSRRMIWAGNTARGGEKRKAYRIGL
jgi:hypothetical protein